MPESHFNLHMAYYHLKAEEEQKAASKSKRSGGNKGKPTGGF